MSTRRLLVLADAAVALAVTAVYLSFAAYGGGDGTPVFTGPAWLAWVTAAAIGLPVAARRRWPVPAAAVAVTGCAAAAVLDFAREPFVPAALVLYAVGASVDRRRSAVVLAAALAVLTAGLVVGVYLHTPSETLPGLLVLAATVGAVAGGGWAAGVAMRHRQAVRLREQARERVRVVAEERLRIARELHDIVSHNLSLIAVQAGVANHVADEQPERAREALRSIESTSKGALAEMRGVLAVLRTGTAGDADRAPAPGLADLAPLVEGARVAGVAVASRVDVREPLPPGIALAVYRIVQESLTNVVKHSGGGACEVIVRRDGGRVTVEVADDGGPRRHDGGHGLIGMRERVLMYGGTFTAGPSGRGFAVRAVLPVESGAAR
ncbi:sensor histidine kinase [Glycomyces niveus]|uniref:histidine kinase n=1 Tax=Glycomyces niveus TaxID=2820287 RepID=A0ABS3U6E9_9ACTN|nr:sensor histidine kinase [Glycomyces sp. NEAU-S30]MBO3734352.1 sensor histidine kinase [Glycomyces sp. NEAU-S30]